MSNGLGPWWFPARFRGALTRWAARYYPSLSWELHDASYAIGTPARWVCDRGFLRAMLSDAARAERVLSIFALSVIAWAMWALVRIFGGWSYNG